MANRLKKTVKPRDPDEVLYVRVTLNNVSIVSKEDAQKWAGVGGTIWEFRRGRKLSGD